MDREASLRSAQRLLGLAAVRLVRLSDGVDDWDADEARIRLAEARTWVDGTIAVGHWWMRRAVDAAAIGVTVWVVAALCGQVIGLGSGWTITIAIVAAQVVAWVAVKFHRVVERLRVRRDGVEEVWIPPGTGPEAELLGLLKLARTRLVDAGGPRPRAAGPGRLVRAASGYVSLYDSRRRGHRISTAERYLCQAVAATERWQATVRDPR